MPKTVSAVDWIKHMFGEVDKIVADMIGRAEASGDGKLACRGSGCSFCCYDVSGMSPIEMAVASNYAIDLPDDEKAIIRRQAGAYVEAHKEDGTLLPILQDPGSEQDWDILATTRTSLRRNTPCMFLHPESKKCMIYPVRPFACRGHHSLNPRPEMCGERSKNGAATLKAVSLKAVQAWFYQSMRESGLPVVPFGEIHAMLHTFVDADNPDRQSIQGFDVVGESDA